MSKHHLIIAGSRGFKDRLRVATHLQQVLDSTGVRVQDLVVVCGCAPGADTIGRHVAEDNGIKVLRMPAKWRKNGVFDRSAGMRRNEEMAKVADAALVFWDGKSPGSRHMIETMKELGKPVEVVRVEIDPFQ